jgi:hypothetical protein
MSKVMRKTGGRNELDNLTDKVNLLVARTQYGTQDDAAIANGTTVGNLRTVNAADFKIDGLTYTKAATDDLWDFTGEVANGAAVFRAYWLYLDSAGAATFAAGADAATEALAKVALPALDVTKSVVGVFIGGLSTDYTIALSAQGTIEDGVPAGTVLFADAADITSLVAP